MPHTFRGFRRSIITKLFVLGLLILISTGGIVSVNLFSFQQIETLMLTTLDTKIAHVIENARIGREINNVIAETNLLIGTILVQEGALQSVGDHLLKALNNSLTATVVKENAALQNVLRDFNQNFQTLLAQGAVIIQAMQGLETLNNDIANQFAALDNAVGEKMILATMEGNKEASFGLDQLTAMLPEYRQLLLQITILLTKSRQSYLATTAVERGYQQQIMDIFEKLEADFAVISTAGQEFVPLGTQLAETTRKYKDRIAAFYRTLQTFQTQIATVKNAQQQVSDAMANIDTETSRAAATIKSEVTDTTQFSRMEVIVLSVITLIVLLGAAYYTFDMIKPIRHLADVASQIAKGDIRCELRPIESRDEIGVLADAFREMMGYLQHVAGITEKIAEGDVFVNVLPQSERDVLNHSLNKMIWYIQGIANITEKIARRDLHVEVAPKSDQDVLNISLQRMVANLQEMIHATERQIWLKDGISQLTLTLSGEASLVEICQKAVSFAARYVNAGRGVLYAYDHDAEILHLYGTFAFTERDHLSNTYKLGEGVVGQCAWERAPILLKYLTPEESQIITGTFSGAPLNTYTFPLIYNNALYGVMELASFEAFDENKREFLTQANQVIATALFSTVQRERMHSLLLASERAAKEAQDAKADAQQQAEDARKANVRLEEQQQRLQQQNEEFQQMNAQLEEQQQQIQQQREELRQQKDAFDSAQAASA